MVRSPEKKKHKPKRAIKDSLIENELGDSSVKNLKKMDRKIQQAKTLVIDSEDYVHHSIAMMFYERTRLAHKRRVDYIV